MSARILLHVDRACAPAPVAAIESFRPEGRLPGEERRMLARLRALERMLRAQVAEARALRAMLAERSGA